VQSAAVEIRQPEGGRVTLPGNPGGFMEQPRLVAAEYFLGSDPGIGQGTALQPLDDLFDDPLEMFDTTQVFPDDRNFRDMVDLGVRVQDDLGRWSSVQVFKVGVDRDKDGVADLADAFPDDPAASVDTDGDGYPDGWNKTATSEQIAASPLIQDAHPKDPARWQLMADLVRAEYFFNEDPGLGRGIGIALPQSGGDDPLIHFDRYDVEPKGLEPGVHTLYVRVQDENGMWSDVQSAAVEIRQPEGGRVTLPGNPEGFREPPGLVAAEYFYGNDPGTGNAVSLDLGDLQGWPSILVDVSISVPWEEGVKILGLRVQDADGEWSDTRRTTVAVYDPDNSIQYIVTPSALEGGSIEPATPQTVQQNHSLAFIITPDEGYVIDTFSGCGGTLDDMVYTTGEITGDCMVQVSFARKQCHISPTSETFQGGSLEGTGIYDYGSSVTVTAKPDTGYHFVEWTDGVVINPRIYENITTDINVGAIFAINQYTVTVGSTEGGSTNKEGTHIVDHGGAITITATPEPDFHFTGWGGDASGTDNPLTVSNIASEKHITASFQATSSGHVISEDDFTFTFTEVSELPASIDPDHEYFMNFITSKQVVDGKDIYIAGGYLGSSNGAYICSRNVYRYSIKDNSWTDLGEILPFGITNSNTQSVYHDGKLYWPPTFVSGNSNGWGNHKAILKMDLGTKTVEETVDIKNSYIWSMGIERFNDQIYFFGGHSGRDNPEIYSFSPENNKVEHVLNMAIPRGNARTVKLNNKIYIFGGRLNSQDNLKE